MQILESILSAGKGAAGVLLNGDKRLNRSARLAGYQNGNGQPWKDAQEAMPARFFAL